MRKVLEIMVDGKTLYKYNTHSVYFWFTAKWPLFS